MRRALAAVGSPVGLPALSPIVQLILRLVGLGLVDALALFLAVNIWDDGNWFLSVAIVLTTVFVNVMNLVPRLWPMRWMTPAMMLIGLLAVYPMIYTGYVSLTNYSEGNRQTKVEVIERLETETQYFYLPEGASNYFWTLFRNPEIEGQTKGKYALWLVDEVSGETFFTEEGQALEAVTPYETGTEPFDDQGIPASYKGYEQIKIFELLKDEAEKDYFFSLTFGGKDNPIGIVAMNKAGNYRQRWYWEEDRNAFRDDMTGMYYQATDEGQFVAPNNEEAPLGFWKFIGLENYKEVFTSSLKDGPLLAVFLWTVAFSFFSVLTAFSVGLLMALLLEGYPFARYIRSLLLIPWAIPGMIGILIWRGMLRGTDGVIPAVMRDLFNWAPPFFTDPGWAKFAILLVNLWFAYPYFMLITSGTLQSIPAALYEAAEVDGANVWSKFWKVTLPLLLVSVGPLLVASFVFNFNNYLLIEALNGGGPQMTEPYAPPVGHTDNLITYTYNYAFSSGGGGGNFGLASAIAVLIFFIVGMLTIFQFQLTRRWEEVGENV
ncbi:MAG: ABC transporter permease subunit [Anaerolineae bacterium]|nr:ABC transporter permease subunit [Anaerolineae bacterium]